MYTTGIVVRDLRMVDSPFWNNHLFDCEDVLYERVTIQAPRNAPNTDGWDPDSSRNVLIQDSSYTGGDDCVAIKSGWDCFGIDYGKPSKAIHIRNISCHGRFAGIAIGSEMSGGVEDVLVEDVRFTLANGAAHIKTSRTRGGYVRFLHVYVGVGCSFNFLRNFFQGTLRTSFSANSTSKVCRSVCSTNIYICAHIRCDIYCRSH
jgi:polygalacturonase